MIRRFAKNIFYFLFINVAIILAILFYINKRDNKNNYKQFYFNRFIGKTKIG